MAAGAGDHWLTIYESQDGYEFKGKAGSGTFSFDVPGGTIRLAEDRGRAFAQIDGIVFQMFLVARKGPDDVRALDAFVSGEHAFQTGAKGRTGASDVCSKLPLRHREWRLTMPNGATSIFVESLLRDQILVIVAGTDAAKAPQAEDKIRAACNSFAA